MSGRRQGDLDRRQARSVLLMLFARQCGKCFYCGAPMRLVPRGVHHDGRRDLATIDHKIPVCAGGRSNRGNLVAAHAGCNRAKGDSLDYGQGASHAG